MISNVYLNRVASFLPNSPVNNDEMESYLGLVNGKASRVKPIILRQNGIKTRYYALTKDQQITHTNVDLAKCAINGLGLSEDKLNSVQFLSCGTSMPDQYMPSHAAMVHGAAFSHPMEIFSLAGVCMTSIAALKTAYMSVLSGNSKNAICSNSELVSPVLLSKFFEEEYHFLKAIKENPILAFNKDFLRFMLSDGAACCYLQNNVSPGVNLEINWIETISFANQYPACMYMWGDYDEEGVFRSWKEFDGKEILEKSVWCIKQDIKLLNEVVVVRFVDAIEMALNKYHVNGDSIDYVIPHISSMYFYNLLAEELERRDICLPTEKWFTNLTTVGNVGSVAIFAGLDELVHSGRLIDGNKILLLVPESGRFTYGVVLLTVKCA